LGSGLNVVGTPSIELLRVVNRDDEAEDRVVVRVRVRVHCRHPREGLVATRRINLDERWTLGRSGSRWILLSMGGDPLAGPVLAAPLVRSRADDTERLREESLAELGDAQKVGDDVELGDLVDKDEPPALALLDLSILDGRFLPALIAAQLAHLLDAWEEAVSGSEAPFKERASTQARSALLRPGRGTHLVIQDVVLKSWEPTSLDLSRRPPAIEVTLEVDAIRYVANGRGRGRAGNEKEPRRMVLQWCLELTDSARAPWRLITSNNPAESIPGWTR
jgi:hypothetical protein